MRGTRIRPRHPYAPNQIPQKVAKWMQYIKQTETRISMPHNYLWIIQRIYFMIIVTVFFTKSLPINTWGSVIYLHVWKNTYMSIHCYQEGRLWSIDLVTLQLFIKVPVAGQESDRHQYGHCFYIGFLLFWDRMLEPYWRIGICFFFLNSTDAYLENVEFSHWKRLRYSLDQN